jgi:serine/threonine protein kinase/Tol biopolymer transport system component
MTSPGPSLFDRLSASLADRYRIERELGQGGMSTVFLAEDLKHHREVAIKVLREDLAASMGSARFLREIQIAAQLQHPNILPLLDSGSIQLGRDQPSSDASTLDSRPSTLLFYVMPYVKGQSLRDRLDREGELPIGEAVRLLTEVVDALATAHEHGVVHRDIKPDNVMISGRHALVTDFGVAKAVAEGQRDDASHGKRSAGITTLGVAVGTPAYMSPEQAAADPHVDQRSDIYAVGAMAYELLTGRPPFTGATPQQVLAAQVTEQPEPVSKRRASVPPALEAIVMRCLEKRPADRWQNASELLTALEPLATPSGGVTPTQLTPVSIQPAGTPRAMWALIGLGVVVLAIGAAAVWRHRDAGGIEPQNYQRVQITSSGNASQPFVSPDGKQIVYSSSECGDNGSCNVQLVLFDRQTGARQTLADSMDEIEPLSWSGDDAWLMVAASAPSRGYTSQAYVLSHLGGQMIGLGGFGAMTPQGDTALVTARPITGRNTTYLRRFVPPWTQPVDSVAITAPSDPATLGITQLAIAPSGKWIAATWAVITGRILVYVYDRKGTAVDSMTKSSTIADVAWAHDGKHLLGGIRTAQGEAALVRVAINSSTGRFGSVDTVFLGASGGAPHFSLSADGSILAYTITQAGETTLWTLRAQRSGTFPQPERKVRSASAQFSAAVTPDGSTIIYTTRTATATGTAIQYHAEPFGGGADRTLTPPLSQVSNAAITSDGRHLVVASPSGSDATRLTSYTIPSGASTVIGDFPGTPQIVAAGSDGIALISNRGDSITVVDGSGKTVGGFGFPDSVTTPFAIPSPDGRELAVFIVPKDPSAAWGSDQNLHVPIDRVTLDGRFTPIAVARANTIREAFWTTGGSLWWIGNDASDQRLAIYRVPVLGGEPKRGELLPFTDGCQCDLSADGTRGTAVVAKPITDVWVITNFKQ